jgi:hypothetical protein
MSGAKPGITINWEWLPLKRAESGDHQIAVLITHITRP